MANTLNRAHTYVCPHCERVFPRTHAHTCPKLNGLDDEMKKMVREEVEKVLKEREAV